MQVNKIQTHNNHSPAFKAWLKLDGAKNLLSDKCTKEIMNSAAEVGDVNDMISIYISKSKQLRDNSWSEIRHRFTVQEYIRETYMSAIINAEHFVKSFETKGDNDCEIGSNILEWLKTLPRYED